MKVIKYGADWCAQCNQMAENLRNAGISFTEVDVDEYPDIADSKGITTIPVTEFVDETDGDKVLERYHGSISVEELIEVKNRYKM